MRPAFLGSKNSFPLQACLSATLLANLLVFNFFLVYIAASLHPIVTGGEALVPGLPLGDVLRDPVSTVRRFLAHEPEGAPLLAGLTDMYAGFLGNVVSRLATMDASGHMQSVIWDVSTGREFSFIWRRIAADPRPNTSMARLVVDIGAMNGFAGSNSYNFVQNGWRAVLVEPQEYHMRQSRLAYASFIGAGAEVAFVDGAVGLQDGSAKMCIFERDNSRTSATLLLPTASCRVGQDKPVKQEIVVPVVAVATLIRENRIPCGPGESFGVLTIDAEAFSQVVMNTFLVNKCRPRFMIVEVDQAHPLEARTVAAKFGYALAAQTSPEKSGFRNDIFELLE